MITASHNPDDYNGLKLFNPNGSSFTQKQQVDMEELLKSRYWTDWQHQGSEHTIDALTPHKGAILESVHIKPGITVVADCGNGAGLCAHTGSPCYSGCKNTLYQLQSFRSFCPPF